MTYAQPVVSGGTAPLVVSCTPASGSTVSVGTSAVACTVTDAARQTASCAFSATVLPAPVHLNVSTVLAFGDSITEGEVPVPGEFQVLPRYVEPDKSYPADLVAAIAARYTTQTTSRVDAFCASDPPASMANAITIVNAGCLGEPAGGAGTAARLSDKMAMYHPDLVLLMEGTNDLDSANPSGSVAAGVAGIQTLVQLARGRGAVVFVGTIPPQVSNELTHGGTPGLVVPYNTALAPAAAAAGGQVVDIYGDLTRDVPDWMSPLDGLHPTEAGYAEIANVWLAAIEARFQVIGTARVKRH